MTSLFFTMMSSCAPDVCMSVHSHQPARCALSVSAHTHEHQVLGMPMHDVMPIWAFVP